MYVNIRKGQEVLLAFPVDLFCIITILRHDIIACQRTCFIKIHHTYHDIYHNRMGKFDFLRVTIHAMGIAESGKIHAPTRSCVWEPAPAFCIKGVTVAASAPPESIRLAAVCCRQWMLKSGGRTALGRHWGFGPVELRPPGAGKLESARLLSFVVRF